ncbi:MAG: polysaccharide deacetylase family protein [Fimbriimonas ginsengisoli]|nr:polysaccharide deacetylase family protein [Fimbriimonas ginsengisoli]
MSNRPGNLHGGVFVIEYHKIAAQEARWDRSIARFRGDLERLYKMGFRPITIGQFIAGKMPLAAGASPVAITFDDAHPSQFQILPDGSVDPECAVGVWQAFATHHPDFPVRATFFVLPNLWGQRSLVSNKVALLRSWGCELGNHTMTHRRLDRLSDDEVKAEIGGGAQILARLGTGIAPLALPYGMSPRDKSLLRGFQWKGGKVEIPAVVLVGAGPSRPAGDPAFDRTRIPRIQGIEGENGITDWLDQVEAGKVKPYVQP